MTDKKKKIKMSLLNCPLCGQSTLQPKKRLIKDSCGHAKCRMCLLKEEDGCNICKNEKSIIHQSLPIKLLENSNNNFLCKIICKISNNLSLNTSIEKERLTISEIIEEEEEEEEDAIHNVEQFGNNYKNNDFNSKISKTLHLNNYKSMKIETEKTNFIQKTIFSVPNKFSMHDKLKDFLLFKNPILNYNSCPSPEFRLSDYIVIKSPTRIENVDQSTNLLQLDNNCLTISKNSNDNDEYQIEQTVCYMLTNKGELVKLNDFTIMEYSNDLSTKTLMIDYVTPEINKKSANFSIEEEEENKENNNKIDDSLTFDKSIEKINDKNDNFKQKVSRKRKKTNVKESVKNKRRKQNRDWSHIENLPDSPKRYKCTVCQKVFKNLQGRLDHSACRLGIIPYKCNFENCGRTFNKSSHFEYHKRTHTGDKPFECDLCKKKFIQKNKLSRHLACVHNQCEVECSECGKKFNSKEYLKRHVVVHQGKTYKCKFCEKTFTLNANKKRHELSHSSNKPHQCDVCTSKFKTKFLLTRHKRIHDNNRPFSCKHCQRVFLSKSEVQRHVACHFDEKLYSCKECEFDFRRKDNLKRHIKHHHAPNEFDKLAVIKTTGLKKNEDKSSASKIQLKSNFMEEEAKEEKKKLIVKKTTIGIKQFPEVSNKTKCIKLTDPIPLEDVININRKIEESQTEISCDFPGLTSRKKVSYSKKNNINNSKDEINFIQKQERLKTGRLNAKEKILLNYRETDPTNFHTHWRRRITESFEISN